MATANEISMRRRNAEQAADAAAKLRAQVVAKNAAAKKPGLLETLTNKVKAIGTQPAPMSADAKAIADRDAQQKALRKEVGGR